uniref:Uncharacterized protein n=1 Tax=Sphaerodactylus townsendi TaxID=933632 RepID=A0ACB8EIK4_9SAUR
MAAAAGEQKELLALMHKHLVQIGYEKAAKELLRQSGQKNFPSPSVPLEDIFIQWKKASFQAQKRKGDDIKTDIPAKIRIPDPESSSETSEEEDVASPVKTNLPVNNSSTAQAESSSEDEDSSSEEDVVSGKIVKPTVTGNQTATPLQLAAQKANSVPGKGVAIASVQAKERPNKANSNKPSPLLMAKAGQNKVLSGKPEAASPSQILKGQTTAPVTTAQKAAASESSSSSSESEEEMTSTAVKTPAPQQALKKTESSSEDSSEDSDSEEEEESNAAAVQIKPAVQRPPISAMPVKSCPTPVTSSKGSTVKVSQVFKGQTKTQVSIAQKVVVSETSSSSSESEEEKTSTTIKAPIPKPALEKTESSSEDSSEDSDSEEEESNAATVQVKPAVQSPQISATSVKSSPVTVASSKGSTVKASLAKTKAKSSEKTPQTSAASVKNALPNLLSSKATSTPAPLKQTSKPSVPSLVKPALLPPVKVAGSAESSESSESSSESEDEVLPVPVSQKVGIISFRVK